MTSEADAGSQSAGPAGAWRGWREQTVRVYREELLRHCPDFEKLAGAAINTQLAASSQLVARVRLNRAARMIYVLAISDLQALLDDVGLGAGRSATRTTRSLIEHAINMGTVAGDDAAGERYVAHLDRGSLLMADSPYAVAGLDSKRRKVAVHYLNKSVGSARQRWDAALARYGRQFRTSWTTHTLADRAKQQGLSTLYDAYRIASDVTHGSSAGSFGHYFAGKQDGATFAVGRVPSLAPFALAAGLEAFVRLLQAIEAADGSITFDIEVYALASLATAASGGVWDAAQAVTRDTQRLGSEDVAESTLIAVVSRSGRIRWYVHHHRLADRWFAGKDLTDADEVVTFVKHLVDAFEANGGEYSEGGLVAVQLPRLAVAIDYERHGMPAAALFPRLIPSLDMTEWQVVTGLDPTGEYEVEGRLIPNSPLEVIQETGVHGDGIDWWTF